ncbi:MULTISPECIES: ABC transporter substrate-binding protein [unclassified Streptomyces]|uniref:ABC transporter substrate-binding protein n=1 Tax=unclassified Streptomyces TaxID=2593676 RepID=UPI00278C7667|nr:MULTISPECIES: ABC transporter substrate-binding protein [unclassified Streptomyces]
MPRLMGGKQLTRRTFCTAATGAALLGAAGCGGDTTASGDGRLVLTFWHGFTEADGKTIAAIVREFNASHPHIRIDVQVNPWDVITSKLLPAVAAKAGPDIVAQPTTSAAKYIKVGAFRPLDDFYRRADARRYLPNAVRASTVEGRRYGAPLAFAANTLFYNKKLFARHGIDGPPDTWDAWVRVARRLTVGDGTPRQYGLSLSSHGPSANTLWTGMLHAGGGRAVHDGRMTIDSRANRRTLGYWQDAVARHRVSPKDLGDAASLDLFTAQKAAMVVGGPFLTLIAKRAGIDYGISAVPAGPASAAAGANVLAMYLTSQADRRKTAAIHEFFTFFNSKQQQLVWSRASGWPPNRTDIPPSAIRGNPDVAAIARCGPHAVTDFEGVENYTELATELDTVTQKTISGQDVASVLAQAQSRMQRKLDLS